MEKKEYLCRYHNLEMKIEKKKAYIAFCNEKASSIPGQDFSIERVDYTPSFEAPFVKWVLNALDAERELKELIELAESIKNETIHTINKMKNEDEKNLLIYHYIDWLSWTELEDAMYASKSTLIRIHKRALDNLVL